MRKAAVALLAVVLSGCVSTPSGGKRFDPWEATKRVDTSFNLWLDRQTGMSSDPEPKMWNQ